MIEPDDETPTDVHLQAAPALAGVAATASLSGASATIAAVTRDAGELLLVLRDGRFPVAGGPDDLLGPPAHQLDLARLRATLSEADQPRFDALLDEVSRKPDRQGQLTLRARHTDGRPLLLELRAVNRSGDPLVDGVVLHLRDVTERSRRDPCTQLPNRDHFLQRLQRLLDQEDADAPLALFLATLERHAHVLRTLGTAAADLMLQQATRRLEDLAMPSWTLARVGEAEFGLLIRGGLPATAVARLEEDITRLGREPFDLNGQAVLSRVTCCSLVPPQDARDADRILRDADEALGLARGAATGEIAFAGAALPPDSRATEAALREALDAKALRLAWQPIVRLADQTVVGLEALIRWKSDTHGTMSPASFLPVARRSGLIVPVGTFVLRSAINQLRRWQSKVGQNANLYVSVNVAREELAAPGFVQTLAEVLDASLLPANCLQLELPPDALAEQPGAMAEVLAALHALGVRLALDDFGGGTLAVRQLRELPLHAVKIAPDFVHGPEGIGTESGRAVFTALVQLARGLGIEVAAKGVEGSKELEAVRSLGASYAQGYHLGKPAGPRAVRGMLD